MKATLWSVALAATLAAGTAVAASVDVGGAAMFPEKNIVQNAVNSKDHTTLVAAVKAAGLVAQVGRPRANVVLVTIPHLRRLRAQMRGPKSGDQRLPG